MDRKHNILLVEDDPTLGYLLKEYLTMKSFEITVAETGEKGIAALQKTSYDLVILDVMLPDKSGFDLATQIKVSHPNLPFIFLTARSLKVDVLKGFALGAVDYLKKPIDEEELVVRINNLLSRLQAPSVSKPSHERQRIGKFYFEPGNQQLKLGKEVTTLTKRETELLHYLIENKNNLCSHTEILDHVWGSHDYFNKKSLNVFISRLRKYLEADDTIKIENIHKQGFILRVH